MEFHGDPYRYHVVFTDMERIILEVFTPMSVMLNLGRTMAVVMLPQYPEEELEVAVLDIHENAVLPMRHGDILINEREWFLQGRFMYPQEEAAPQNPPNPQNQQNPQNPQPPQPPQPPQQEEQEQPMEEDANE